DLGHAGAGDVAQAGDLGHVVYFAAFEQALEVDGEGHQARQTRDAASFRRAHRLGCGADDQPALAVLVAFEVDVGDDREVLHSLLLPLCSIVWRLGLFYLFGQGADARGLKLDRDAFRLWVVTNPLDDEAHGAGL